LASRYAGVDVSPWWLRHGLLHGWDKTIGRIRQTAYRRVEQHCKLKVGCKQSDPERFDEPRGRGRSIALGHAHVRIAFKNHSANFKFNLMP
jgi:hypothetical protein